MPSAQDPSSLIHAADTQVARVRTQGKDYSFNELLSMYDDKELVIDPEYQRLFRWDNVQQSRFIESLILELPLPPVFVIELDDSKYELIDGLQRISSYFHFRGKLNDSSDDDQDTFLTLEGCDIVKELNGYTYSSLPAALEIKLKRHSIRVEVIRKESDKRLRYHMFKRLNTGGSLLSEQEIRNCTIRLLDDTVNRFIIDCSKNDDFVNTISLVNSERIDAKYDQELVLRFFAFKTWRSKYSHNVGEFLTDFMEAVADPNNLSVLIDYDAERQDFNQTFSILNAAMKHKVFSPLDRLNRSLPFGIYVYEAITLGIQDHLSKLNSNDATQMEKLKECLWELKGDDTFKTLTTGGGKNFARLLEGRIELVRDRVGAMLQ